MTDLGRPRRRMAMILAWWASAILLAASPAEARTAQTTVFVYGEGVTPTTLEHRGNAPPETVIETERGTIVMLEYRWGAGELTCVERYVIHDGRHRVRDSNPTECPDVGDGSELDRALAGGTGVTRMAFAFLADARADAPLGSEERAFMDSWRVLEGRGPAEDPPTKQPPTEEPPTEEPPTEDPAYATYIGAPAAAMCFHKKEAGWNNGNPVHLWNCNVGEPAWKTWVYEGSTGYIRNAARPDKCLHRKENDWSNGNPVHLWDCDAGSASFKTWRYDPESGRISARANANKCIHKQFNNWQNGNPLHLWDCRAGGSEMKSWRLRPSGYEPDPAM